MNSAKKSGGARRTRDLASVLTVTLFLALCHGKIRGDEPDRWAGQLVQAAADAAERLLSTWCVPALAATVVWGGQLFLVCVGFLLAGDLCRRRPSLSEFNVESDLGLRRGRRLSGLLLALGYSLPFAAGVALTSKGDASVYASAWVSLGYLFVVASTERESSGATLNVYARFRNAWFRGRPSERGAEETKDPDGE